MKNIGEFLVRIAGVRTKELLLRKVVIDVLDKYIKRIVDSKNISFRTGKVIIKSLTPTEKSFVFLKKQAILSDIQNSYSQNKLNIVIKEIVMS